MRIWTASLFALTLSFALALPLASALAQEAEGEAAAEAAAAETETPAAEPAPAAKPKAAAKPKKTGAQSNAKRKNPQQKPMTTQTGSISAVDAAGVSVELASGKTARYARGDTTQVRGQKREWEKLADGDRVKVRVRGKNLQAVVVLPTAAEQAEIDAQRKQAADEYRAQQKKKANAAGAKPIKKKQQKQKQTQAQPESEPQTEPQAD